MDELISSSSEVFAGRYRMLRLLGKGGMGKVYLAEDTVLVNELVAIKILRPELTEDKQHTERFLREVQLTRKVTHPNIVRTFDVGFEDGVLFFTMEYVEGTSLRECFDEGSVKNEDVPEILLEICQGLTAIHDAGIVHRDLKARNVVMCLDGSVKIADFGVARPDRSDMTCTSEVVGSVQYMSPEAWRGEPVGPGADLYSLGILTYRLLTSRLPFESDTSAGMMFKHLEEKPVAVGEHAPDVPLWLEKLTLKLLEKDAVDRPASAEEVVREIITNCPHLENSLGPKSTPSVAVSQMLNRPVETAKQPGYIPGSTSSPEDNEPCFFDEALPTSATFDEKAETHTPLILSELNPKNRLDPEKVTPWIDPSGIRERNSFIAEKTTVFRLKKSAKHFATSLMAAVFIGWLLLSPVSYLLARLKVMYSTSSTIAILPIYLILTMATYVMVMSLPVLVLKLISSTAKESVVSWLKMSGRLAALGGALFLFYVAELAVHGVSASSSALRVDYISALRAAMTNLVEVASFGVVGTFYRTSVSFRLPEVVVENSPGFVNVIPYYTTWIVFVLLLIRFAEKEIFKVKVLDKALYLMLIPAITLFSCVMYGLINLPFLYLAGIIFGSPDQSLQFGPFVMPLSEYFILLFIINWTIVISLLMFFMPSIVARLRGK